MHMPKKILPLLAADATARTGNHRPKLAELSGLRDGFAKSFDDTMIWYQDTGKGLPLVFCNGLGCSTFYWNHVTAHFRHKARTIIFDWRVHGHSHTPKNTENMTVDALTLDLKAVLDKLKIKKAVLIGHSMGTQVLYRFYELYPKRVAALVPCFGTYGNMIDTFYDLPFSKYAFEVVYVFNHIFPKTAHFIGQMIANNPLWYQIGGLLKMMQPALADRKILREYLDHLAQFDPILLAKLARSMQQFNAEPLLKKIRVPTLIFAGDNDKFTPMWLSKKMHRLIPKSELCVVKGGTHVALVEQPDLICLRVEKFLQERMGKKAFSLTKHILPQKNADRTKRPVCPAVS